MFKYIKSADSEALYEKWLSFLTKSRFDFSGLQAISFLENCPVMTDLQGNKFKIDFIEDRTNYHKKKSNIKSELISRALGGGRLGLRLLDLTAGLAIDSVFLAQLGFTVTALERNPLIFLALEQALAQYKQQQQLLSSDYPDLALDFQYSSAQDFLNATSPDFDVIYFDPMFPQKTKSALPRQEMVFFKNLVGSDLDADQVLQQALNMPGVKRVVVKRPLKAPCIGDVKPQHTLEGKLIRFDIYNKAIHAIKVSDEN